MKNKNLSFNTMSYFVLYSCTFINLWQVYVYQYIYTIRYYTILLCEARSADGVLIYIRTFKAVSDMVGGEGGTSSIGLEKCTLPPSNKQPHPLRHSNADAPVVQRSLRVFAIEARPSSRQAIYTLLTTPVGCRLGKYSAAIVGPTA